VKYFRVCDVAPKTQIQREASSRRARVERVYVSNMDALHQHYRCGTYREHLNDPIVDREDADFPKVVGSIEASGGRFTFAFEFLREKHDPRSKRREFTTVETGALAAVEKANLASPAAV
jgi:hypothetical protein